MSLFTLYRFYDTDDVLLYVGLSINPGKRFEKHRHTKPWWRDVDRIEIQHFDDLDSLRAAERKAIEDEQPLYNIRMNTRRQPDDLIWICDVCREPVEDDGGWVTISYAEISEHQRQDKLIEARAEERAGGGLKIYSLADIQHSVRWHVYHRECDPDPDGPDYWIEISRIRTMPQLVHWTAHLLAKGWIHDTNWNSILYRHAGKVVA